MKFDQMKIVIVGHVDHGKSTLIGRLFYETESLPEGKYEQVLESCKRRGMQFEWSFLMDALQAERDQEITIDTSQIWFKTSKRNYVIIDAPGHKEFLKNMISGAANSDAAVLIIDAKEGVQEQSRRHGYLLHLLGIEQIIVVINKMDLVGFSEKVFNKVKEEYCSYLEEIGVTAKYVIPVSARQGDNISKISENMPWYKGRDILSSLDLFVKTPSPVSLPLRLPVQDVYRFDEFKRILVGRIESGILKAGDELLFSPSDKVSKVKSIEIWNSDKKIDQAFADMSVGITLEEQIFVERGEVISLKKNPPILTNLIKVRLFWLSDKSAEVHKKFVMKINTSEYKVEIREIEKIINTEDLSSSSNRFIQKNDVAEAIVHIKGLAAIDEFSLNYKMGRFILADGYDIVAGGIISMNGFTDQRVAVRNKKDNIFPVDDIINSEQRAFNNGHLGGIVWFAGLSGSGKTTLAMELEKRLFNKGYQVYVLDGDNIRKGLCSDLGFSSKDRSENLRRVSEVAALFAKAGFIVINAFISPYSEGRKLARSVYPENFHSVYIKVDQEICESRDVKGLYAQAREGKIKNFTGISDKFEEPDNADLIIENGFQTISESADCLEKYVEDNFVAPIRNMKASVAGEGI